MSSFENSPRDFDDLDMPTGGLDMAADLGMADPIVGSSSAAAGASQQRERRSRDALSEAAGPGLLARLAQASPYTVMLGIALAFILMGILCLFKEYGAYHFDRAANSVKTVSSAGHASFLGSHRV